MVWPILLSYLNTIKGKKNLQPGFFVRQPTVNSYKIAITLRPPLQKFLLESASSEWPIVLLEGKDSDKFSRVMVLYNSLIS